MTCKKNIIPFKFGLLPVSALFIAVLALSTPTVYAAAFTVFGTLTGDIRPENPDDLIVDVTITGDTTSNVVHWVIDINSPLHPDIKLDEFYFNMAGLAGDYSFSGFDPTGWTVSSPAGVQGAGGASFMFESLDPAGPPNAADVTNSQNLALI